jgi:hypothetical protein
MLPRWHILFGFIFSYSLCYFFNFSLLAGAIIFLSAIFIDLDHVLLYSLETKNLHPKKFFNWSERKALAWENLEKEERDKLKSPQFILHGIEFLIALIVFSKFNIFFYWVLLGIIFHLLLDLMDIYNQRKFSPMYIKLSQIWTWHRNKNKKHFKIN